MNLHICVYFLNSTYVYIHQHMLPYIGWVESRYMHIFLNGTYYNVCVEGLLLVLSTSNPFTSLGWTFSSMILWNLLTWVQLYEFCSCTRPYSMPWSQISARWHATPHHFTQGLEWPHVSPGTFHQPSNVLIRKFSFFYKHVQTISDWFIS